MGSVGKGPLRSLPPPGVRKRAGVSAALLLLRSHLGLLTLAIVPAVTGLGNQQRDEVALLEAQQSAVVDGRVGENGLDPHAAVAFEASCHGARTWQRLVLSCRDNGCVRERTVLVRWSRDTSIHNHPGPNTGTVP